MCRFALSILMIALTLTAQAGPSASAIRADEVHSPSYRSINNQFRRQLDIPNYFTVPLNSFLELPQSLLSPSTVNSGERPMVVFNYRETVQNRINAQNPETYSAGFRIFAVDGKDNSAASRAESAQLLAESGAIQTGDILLSFRPEWFRSIRYSHIQLGVSHAGLAYVKTHANGKKYVHNIDMPMDSKFMGDVSNLGSNNTLVGEHYFSLWNIHVLRVKGMTDAERANVGRWINMILAQRPYPRKIKFNQNYSAPKYNAQSSAPLEFVADLGRMALGQNVPQLEMFCSEFVWSILSLRKCNPETTAAAFQQNKVPTCVEPVFAPMPVIGNLLETEVSGEAPVIGMADGPIMMSSYMGATGRQRSRLINRSVFGVATNQPERISAGHRAVEEAILAANPQFYDHLRAYFDLTDMTVPQNQSPQAQGARTQMRNGFNATQALNYSPTAFLVHAQLRPEESVKKIDYVGTVMYMKPVQMGIGGNANPYNILLQRASGER